MLSAVLTAASATAAGTAGVRVRDGFRHESVGSGLVDWVVWVEWVGSHGLSGLVHMSDVGKRGEGGDFNYGICGCYCENVKGKY